MQCTYVGCIINIESTKHLYLEKWLGGFCTWLISRHVGHANETGGGCNKRRQDDQHFLFLNEWLRSSNRKKKFNKLPPSRCAQSSGCWWRCQRKLLGSAWFSLVFWRIDERMREQDGLCTTERKEETNLSGLPSQCQWRHSPVSRREDQTFVRMI